MTECRSLKHQALFNFSEEPLAQDFQKGSDTIPTQRCSINQTEELETGGRNADAKVIGQVRDEKVSLWVGLVGRKAGKAKGAVEDKPLSTEPQVPIQCPPVPTCGVLLSLLALVPMAGKEKPGSRRWFLHVLPILASGSLFRYCWHCSSSFLVNNHQWTGEDSRGVPHSLLTAGDILFVKPGKDSQWIKLVLSALISQLLPNRKILKAKTDQWSKIIMSRIQENVLFCYKGDVSSEWRNDKFTQQTWSQRQFRKKNNIPPYLISGPILLPNGFKSKIKHYWKLTLKLLNHLEIGQVSLSLTPRQLQ